MTKRLACVSALTVVASLGLGAGESRAAFVLNTTFSTDGINFSSTFTDMTGSVRLASSSQALSMTGSTLAAPAIQMVTPNTTNGGQNLNNNPPILIKITVTDTDRNVTSADTITLTDTLTGAFSGNPDNSVNALVVNSFSMPTPTPLFLRLEGLTFTLDNPSVVTTYDSSQGDPRLTNGVTSMVRFPSLTFRATGVLSVPEPASMVLVGMGLGSAAIVARRSARRRGAGA